MIKNIRGQVVMKKDDTMVIRVDDDDIEQFRNLASIVGSFDQVLRANNGKMPKRDLVSIVSERNKAATELETFVVAIYKKYDLDDAYVWAFDPARGECYQTPTKRPLWKFR